MREYETFHLVKGEDLNHHGTLFAARASSWFVEAGFAAAACEHGNADEIVLRNLHSMSFERPVRKGEMVRFASRIVCAGKTSLTAFIIASNAISGEKAVEGFITFVTVEQATGKKKPHHVALDETGDAQELLQREQVSLRMARSEL